MWTLHARLRRAIVVSGVSLGLVLVLALLAFAQLARYVDEVTDAIFSAVIELEELQADLIDADAAVRAHALGGGEELLAPYTELAYDRAELIQAGLVEDGVSDEVRLDPLFERLGRAIDEWRAGYVEPLVAATRAGVSQDAFLAAQTTGAELFDETLEALRAALDELIDHRTEGASAMRTWQRVLLGSVLALAVAGILTGVVLWRYLRRWVTGPLDELADASRGVADGDLDRDVAVAGPEEIVVLGADVDRMRRHLVSQIATTESARRELEASNRDLEQFAYVASHDLQEPLRKVASFTQLLQRRYGDQLDDRGHQYIEFAADGAKRMQRLIQDLLAFSRLGRVEAEPDLVPLDRCVAEALENLSEVIEESGATVTHDPLPEVVGHAGILTQLLQNLVANAIKFRRPDVQPEVHIGVQRIGREWLLRCSDNGIGIEPRHAERVFAIFQRLHAKDAYAGTGIGLAMCKRIVEYHGGRIWVEHQDPGNGTTVRWTMPADSAGSYVLGAPRSGAGADEDEQGMMDHEIPGSPGTEGER